MPPPTANDWIEPPGATTSGFNVSPPTAGPFDENSDRLPSGSTEPTVIAERDDAGEKFAISP